MVITLFNGLLGALCGVWFRVQILIPLIAFAFVEVAIVNRTIAWSSAFWLVIMIVAIEVGYLAGSSSVALPLSSNRAEEVPERLSTPAVR